VQHMLLAAAEADNGIDYKVITFGTLVFCGVVIFLVELVKHMDPEVTIEKLAALGLVVCFLAGFMIVGYTGGTPLGEVATYAAQLLIALAPLLALIWFDDVFGNMVGLKGLVSKASPDVLVRLMGWILLLGTMGLAVYFALQE